MKKSKTIAAALTAVAAAVTISGCTVPPADIPPEDNEEIIAPVLPDSGAQETPDISVPEIPEPEPPKRKTVTYLNVLADGGLVGIVESVGPNWSKVKSVIADNSNVSGTVLATGDLLMVSGDLQAMERGVIRFGQLVDSESNVAVGDKVVTSDISSLFLPDILIGYIDQIDMDANNLTKSGFITPAVDFEHLSEVLVILELKQTIPDT